MQGCARTELCLRHLTSRLTRKPRSFCLRRARNCASKLSTAWVVTESTCSCPICQVELAQCPRKDEHTHVSLAATVPEIIDMVLGRVERDFQVWASSAGASIRLGEVMKLNTLVANTRMASQRRLLGLTDGKELTALTLPDVTERPTEAASDDGAAARVDLVCIA